MDEVFRISADEIKEKIRNEKKIRIVKVEPDCLILNKIEALNSNDEVIGKVNYIKHGKPFDGLIEIYNIEVDIEFQGKSLARALFDNLVKLEKPRKLFLLTHVINIRARKFYEKMGMKQEAILKEHWHSKKDEVVYSRFF